MTRKTKAYACCMAAMVLVGTTVVAGRVVVDQNMPLGLAMFLRYVAACMVMLPLVYWKEGGLPRLGLRDWGLLALQAFCGVVLFNGLLIHGLRFTDPASAGVITATTPAMVGLLSILLLRERIRPATWWAIGLAVAGVAMINLARNAPGLEAAGQARWWGNLLVLGAVAGEAVFLLIRKTLHARPSALAASSILCLMGLVQFAPLALWEAWAFDWASPDLRGYGAVAYFGVVVTAGAYLLWFKGIVHLEGGRAGVTTSLMPISAIAFSALVLDAPVTGPHLVSCALVLGAIILASRG